MTGINSRKIMAAILVIALLAGLVPARNLTAAPFGGGGMMPSTEKGCKTAPVAGFWRALTFSNSRIDVPYNDSTKLKGNSDFTVSMWICPMATTGCKTLYRQYGTGDGTLGVWLRYEYDGSDGQGYLYFGFDDYGKGGWQWAWPWGSGIPAHVTKFPLNQWVHVALTKSGTAIKTYVNGVEDYETVLEAKYLNTTFPDNGKISIGGDTAQGNYYLGSIDEIRFWGKALTREEIGAWMYRGIDKTHPNYDDLVYYYKLDDCSEDPVTDSKGLNHGTAFNVTNGDWTPSNIRDWAVNAGSTICGQLVGSDVDGTSANGIDWKQGFIFQIIENGSKGTAAISEDNRFTYGADANQEGSDFFKYRVVDPEGNYSEPQRVNLVIIPARTISGYVGVAGTSLSYTDGTAKEVVSDETGFYSIKVPYHWSGRVTPTQKGYTFDPEYTEYVDVQVDQYQNYFPVITSANISGLKIPGAGVAPQGVGDLTAADSSYTVTGLTWQNGDGTAATLTTGGKFRAGSTYQAQIELTSAADYRFKAGGFTPTVDAGTAGAGTTSGGDVQGNRLTFTVTFESTAPVSKDYDTKIPSSNPIIARFAGANRVDTALAIARALYPSKAKNVVLATADNYPDALTGGVLAYRLDAPILLVGNSSVDREKVIGYLKANLQPGSDSYSGWNCCH